MTKQANDILETLESATEDDRKTIPLVNTAYHALRFLIDYHKEQTTEYRKETATCKN